jgi:hypothetical protein
MGVIYEIVSPSGMRYIGSTIYPIETRMGYHIKDFTEKPENRQCYSARVFRDAGSPELCQVNILEDMGEVTREDLVTRETAYVTRIPCINKNIPKRNVPLFRN